MGEERALAPTPSTEKRQQAPTTAPANARQKAPAKGVITEKPVVSTQAKVPLPAALEKAKALKDAQIRTYPQDYANRHAANILDAIETRIRSVEPQQPHPRLRWASRGDAHRTIHLAIRRYVNVVPDLVLKRLMELSYPADLYKITEDALVSPGGTERWVPQVGLAIATAFDVPLASSIERMGMRLRIQLDRGANPRASELVATCPLDGVMAEAVVRRDVIIRDTARANAIDTPGAAFSSGSHEVNYEWLGHRDPRLWNWIRVTSPANPTVEDVARTPLAGGEPMAGSEQAYRIAASPPYFGIPFETARRVPEAWDRAPARVKVEVDSHEMPRIAEPTELGKTVIGDDAARLQAPIASPDAPSLERAIGRSEIYLQRLGRQLGPWIGPGLDGPKEFLERRIFDLATDRAKAARTWTGAAARQERTLAQAAEGVAELIGALAGRGAKRGDPAIAPITKVLHAYHRAAATSHLAAQGWSELARAKELHALLPLALAERKLHLVGLAIAEEGAARGDHAARMASLTTRAADIRLNATQGHLDPLAIDELAADSELLAIAAQLTHLEQAVTDITRRADEVNFTTALYEGGLPTIRALPVHVRTALDSWRKQLALAETSGTQSNQPASVRRRRQIERKQDLARGVRVEIDAFKNTAELDKWLQHAYAAIADKQLRDFLSSLALQLGIMLVTGQVASVALAAVRGAMLAGELATTVRSAGLLFKTAEVATHAGLATVAGGVTGGEVSAKTFAENALAIVLASQMMKPFAALLEDQWVATRMVVEELADQPNWKVQLARSAVSRSVAIDAVKGTARAGAELVTGIAASHLAGSLMGAGDMSLASSEEWITQGLTIAASRMVHERSRRLQERVTKETADWQDARAKKLVADAGKLHADTQKPAGDKETALAQIVALRELALTEHNLREPRSSLEKSTKDKRLREHDDAMFVAVLELGLSRVVSGEVYEAPTREISRVLNAAERTLRTTQNKASSLLTHRDPRTGVWRVTYGKRTVEIHERSRLGVPQQFDGAAIASQFGMSYLDNGFEFDLGNRTGRIAIQRTGTQPRVRKTGSSVVLEIPPTLKGQALEAAVVGQLRQARIDLAFPGDVPRGLLPAQIRVFEEAAKRFHALARDSMQGGGVARVEWAAFLEAHGVHVGGVTTNRRSEIVDRMKHPSGRTDLATPKRSPNAPKIEIAACEAIADELIARGTTWQGARRNGPTISFEKEQWRITISEPRPTEKGKDAGVEFHKDGATVWVSDALANEQLPRALGSVLADAASRRRRYHAQADKFGGLEAMFAHLDHVEHANVNRPKRSQSIKADAIAGAAKESTARITAEIDLQLQRMSLFDVGPAREAKLSQLQSYSSALAERVRQRLEGPTAIGFDEHAVRRDKLPIPTKSQTSTTVLPDLDPKHVRPYQLADRARIVELRYHLEAIREIDARLAFRDQPGTSKTADENHPPPIALGESMRRREHTARTRSLLAELQLGGDDLYLKARLAELEAVFPGAARDISPAITERMQRRHAATAAHHDAQVARTRIEARRQELARRIAGSKPFTTDRLILGDGMAALADIATLGVSPEANRWIDPAKLLVIGEPDLIARLEPRDMWGQRGAAFDRPTDAHPAFGGTSGKGDGSLLRFIEDPGEFVHAGEMRDAMDVARERLGTAAVRGRASAIERLADNQPNRATWEAPEFPVRTKVQIGPETRYVYAKAVDIASGGGEARMPNETILSKADREAMIKSRTVLTGDQMLEPHHGPDPIKSKRVLVLGFGPTSAWAATDAVNRGAARVDWAGSGGGAAGTSTNPRSQMESTLMVDRVQDSVAEGTKIHHTYDRVLQIQQEGKGAVVTYLHGAAEPAEIYKVRYDIVVSSLGYTTSSPGGAVPGSTPTVKDLLGKDMKMRPQRGTNAVVLEDSATGRVRVLGYAASEGTNVMLDKDNKDHQNDLKALNARKARLVENHASADSPNDQVMESAGASIRQANQPRKETR